MKPTITVCYASWPPLILSRTTSASTTTWRGSSVLSLSPPLASFFRADCHPLPGEYGEDLEMGFNDESETDLPGQRQVLRRPRLAQWHGEIFNTIFENRKTVYVSEY